eukprot:scaffold2862_cov458-Pavlova_lutheri.AAC.3
MAIYSRCLSWVVQCTLRLRTSGGRHMIATALKGSDNQSSRPCAMVTSHFATTATMASKAQLFIWISEITRRGNYRKSNTFSST